MQAHLPQQLKGCQSDMPSRLCTLPSTQEALLESFRGAPNFMPLELLGPDNNNMFASLGIDHAYLQLLLKHTHEAHPNIVSMCWILEPVAQSLVRNHQLSSHDDWDTISKELGQYL